MTGSPFHPSPGATPGKPESDIRVLGRRLKWGTLLFLFSGFAVFGVAWLLGLVKFD